MDTLLGLSGYIGVIFMLTAYFLLTIDQIKATDTHHVTLNLSGAGFVIVALHTGNPVPFFVTIVLWLFISLFGLYKHHAMAMES